MQPFLRKHPPRIIAASLALWVSLAILLLAPVTAARAELPPRPEPPSAPTPAPIHGAQIKLQLSEPVADLWTAIQWGDPNTGAWSTIDGWQGSLDADGSQIWWVGPEHFGEGPFRWLLFAGEDGPLLETTAEFMMPTADLQIVELLLPVSNQLISR